MITKRVIRFGLFTSLIQSVLYFMILKIIQLLETLFFQEDNRIISNYLIMLFCILFVTAVFIQNILCAIVNRKWFTWFMFILSTIFLLMGYIKRFEIWPNLYIMITIQILLVSKFKIDKIIVPRL